MSTDSWHSVSAFRVKWRFFLERLDRGALILVGAIIVVYTPSLFGGFLNYDDPWLIQKNPTLSASTSEALSTIWFDWSRETRLVLGAEYLPVRDTSYWIDAQLFGLNPHWMRVTNLMLFASGALAFRGALLRTLPQRRQAELAAALFALHPVHAESVAWLASRKDCLAFLFLGLALWLYVTRRSLWLLAGATALALLSKSMSAVLLPFLPVFDLMARTKPSRKLLLTSALFSAALVAAHLYVGALVKMIAPPHALGFVPKFSLVGELLAGYFANSVFPVNLSIIHAAAAPLAWSWGASLGFVSVVAWGFWGWRAARRSSDESRIAIVAWFCFLFGLAPVLQIVFPLQNLFADRYLLFAVLGPCLLLGHAISQLRAAVWLVPAAFAIIAMYRGYLFGDSVRIFADAHEKYPASAVIAYQLGRAHAERGNPQEAIRLYTIAARASDDAGRRGALSLAKALANAGEFDRALAVTLAGKEKWPKDAAFSSNERKLMIRLRARLQQHEQPRENDPGLADSGGDEP